MTYNNKVGQIVFEVKESPEGGYEAAALGFDIFTQGENWEELKSMVRDAVRAYFFDEEPPAVIRLMLLKEEVMTA